jgi:hypothetical protein
MLSDEAKAVAGCFGMMEPGKGEITFRMRESRRDLMASMRDRRHQQSHRRDHAPAGGIVEATEWTP